MPAHVPTACRLPRCVAWTILLLPGLDCAATPPPAADTAANPMGGGGSVVLEPAPDKPAARPTQRIVFTCVTPGLTTFSDRPCGPLPERRALELPATAVTRSGESATITPPPARASTRPATAPTRAEAQGSRPGTEGRASCRQLQDAVARIDREMRAGYSAREAPRLWERWREARERARAAGCR
ncbi:MAG TPA: hypothetical protein VF851_10920 [Steroidobacteraceae bacterium]